MDSQLQLEALLRKKGIGPEGSKSLGAEDLRQLRHLLNDPTLSLTTQATMLTALRTLKPNPEEVEFIQQLEQTPKNYLRAEFHSFLDLSPVDPFQRLINKTISLTDLNADECDLAVKFLHDANTPEFQKGAFLEAQRLKRESEVENERFFSGMKGHIEVTNTLLPLLIDICDSYDGCKRNAPFSLFTAVVLGTLGYPTLIHGAKKIAPKEGLTAHQLLAAAGKNPLSNQNEVIEHLNDATRKWGYLDQAIYNPTLWSLANMRKEMVKRPFLATFEKLLQPIRAQKNVIITSFTHAHYKQEVMRLLDPIDTVHGVVHVKGVEGTTMPSLSRDTNLLVKDTQGIQEKMMNANQFGVNNHETKTIAYTPEEVVVLGEAAFKGEPGFALDQITYQTAAILHHTCNLTPKIAFEQIMTAINAGAAWRNWKSAQ